MFVAMAATVKAVAGLVPTGEIVFFRSFFALPVILVWFALQGPLIEGIRTARPLYHVWRGLVGTTSMALGFAALGFLPLPEVTVIGYAAPLLGVILAAMFLGEEVRIYRLSAVALGLVGVVIVLGPRLTVSAGADLTQTLGAVLALAAAFFAAVAQVFVRKMVQTESVRSVVFYFMVTAAVLSLVTLPFGWVVPPLWATMLLILAGLLGGLGQIFLTSSYLHAPVSVVAPFEYASILLALAIGYGLFDEVPTRSMLAGAALVILGGVAVIWRERQLGLERSKPRQATPPPPS